MVENAYFHCAKCESLEGGNFGKGPTKSFDGKGRRQCVHKWERITRDRFKTIAEKQHGVDWSKEIPFWSKEGQGDERNDRPAE